MLADFLNVHLCMLVALAAPIVYLTLTNDGDAARVRLDTGIQYYVRVFSPLSPLFLIAFLLNGFYTHSRGYMGRYKYIVILRGVAMSILVFLAANFIISRRELVPRSVFLVFCVLAMLSLTQSRLLKAAMSKRFEIRSRVVGRHTTIPPEEGLVLVLGGAGYIGSCLVRKLLDAGRKVRVVDSLVYGDDAIRDLYSHPDFELRVGDCRNIQDMVAAVRGADSVVHLAAIVGDPACDLDRQTSLEINYAATRMLIEIAKGNGLQRLIFASSCSVYGAADVLMDEHSSVAPISLYGQTKLDSEHALLLARTDSFHPVVLRLATVCGLSSRPRFDLVVNLLTAKAVTEGVITIYNGDQWRPFIHVRDVAEGMIRVLNAPLPVVSGEIFNLGDTRMNYTLTQIAEKIRSIVPSVRVENVWNSDRRNYRVSFDKIRDQIGFLCSHTPEDAILEIRHAFEKNAITDYTQMRYYNQKFLEFTGRPSCKDVLDVHVMAAFAQAPSRAPSSAVDSSKRRDTHRQLEVAESSTSPRHVLHVRAARAGGRLP